LTATKAAHIRVSGLVQGVGFRPFVWRLAQDLQLAGWVRNDAAGVEIHAQGDRIDEFVTRLKTGAPPLAHIDAVSVIATEPKGITGFTIRESMGGKVATAIGHDTAPCSDCLAELFDPANRRYRHAFITCTHCGPRFTVTRHLPYDRPQTSLAPFALCPECQREYTSPANRRFHAETICCPNCGPRLSLLDKAGLPLEGDPIAVTLALLQVGKIVAIKGLGGFHLACDAQNAAAVARLRERKQREEKPFAVMVADISQAKRYGKVDAGGTAKTEIAAWVDTGLASPERPIVLLEKRNTTDALLPGAAPGLSEIGLMLPATPIQCLIFHDAPELALVMTSANPHGEPLVIGNDEALERLADIADAFLLHERDIVVRCDDSLRRPGVFIRRARGYVPRPIKLSSEGPAVLAVGGWFKNTICVTRGQGSREAFVSQHIGDLDNASACGFFEEAVAHLLGILDVRPEVIAHDLHPDFHSTRFAERLSAQRGIPALGVQHHHAHIGAVCAEHGIDEPVLGLALDGVGLGTDKTAWGGELLRVDGASFERLAHLAPLALPGGEVAAREPWRMAAAMLHAIGREEEILRRFADEPAASTVASMLARGLRCPETSSAGRLFDAAAGLLGVRRRSAYEGQAAMLLEALAERHGPVDALAGGWRIEGGRLELLPFFEWLAECKDAALGSARFHATFSAALVEWVVEAARREHMDIVAAAGGCLLNRVLARALATGLSAHGLRFIMPVKVPPNDGGLSLGQAWVARRADAGADSWHRATEKHESR